MGLRVEFFGIPRKRAGVAAATACGQRFGEIIADLASRFPALARECFDQNGLRPGYLASVNGDRFISDSQTPIGPADCLLILSADCGG